MVCYSFNNTKIVEKTNDGTTFVPKYCNSIVDFSDEEKGTEISTSSDDSDNLGIIVLKIHICILLHAHKYRNITKKLRYRP